jgi:hypothetical protein
MSPWRPKCPAPASIPLKGGDRGLTQFSADARQIFRGIDAGAGHFGRHGDMDLLLRHIGIYGYRAGFIRRYVSWAPSPLEQIEMLE